MAKVWKAYVAKHGENPYSADDLMFFSQKCRTVKALSSDRALQVYNKQMNKMKSNDKKANEYQSDHESTDPTGSNQKASRKKMKSSNTEKSRATYPSPLTAQLSKSKTKSNLCSKSKSKSKLKPKPMHRASTQSHLTVSKPRHSRKSSTSESQLNHKPIAKQKKKKKKKGKGMKMKPTKSLKSIKTQSLPSSQSTNTVKQQKTPSSPSAECSPPPSTTTPTKSLFIAVDDDDEEELKTNCNALSSDIDIDTDTASTSNGRIPIIPSSPDSPSSPEDAVEEEGGSALPISLIHSKSLNMKSTLSAFQSAIDHDRTHSVNDVVAVRVNVKKRPSKKGKRYFGFKQFASGAFSKVYKAKDKENGDDLVAIKKIHIGGSLQEGHFVPTTKEEGDNEVRILKLIGGHSNICDLVDTYFDHNLGVNNGYVLCIVMSYMQYTLKQRMEFYADKGDHIPFDLCKIYMFQLCKAVSYMHGKHVCHRDIKPENVLVNASTNELQLCDFGCSLIMMDRENEDEKENKGNETYAMSRYYRAPELILGNGHYGVTADLWSLGAVFAELFLGTIMFMGGSNKDQMREIILKLGWPSKSDLKAMNPELDRFDVIEGVYGVDRKTKGESWSMIFMAVFDMEVSAVECIGKLLVYSPHKRMTAMQCMNHHYFDGVKSLMSKTRKCVKRGKKQKKENVIPLDLFKWTEEEIHFAKMQKQSLRK